MSHLLLLLPRQLTAFRSSSSSSSSIVIQQQKKIIIRTTHPSSSLAVRSISRSSALQMTTNNNNTTPITTTTSMIQITGQPGSIERLCSTSLQACQLLQPLIAAIYTKLDGRSSSTSSRVGGAGSSDTEEEEVIISKTKADESEFTIADGLVQYLLIHVLYNNVHFRNIVGEEEADEEDEEHEDTNSNNNKSEQILHGLSIPTDLEPILQSTKQSIELLSQQYLSTSSDMYKEFTIFIDPIDGTREFINRQGTQCTICIGIANNSGKAVGGVVYRPLSYPYPTWATGVQNEKYAYCNFFGQHDHDDSSSIAPPSEEGHHEGGSGGGLLTTNGPISPFISELITNCDMMRIKSGGAGNKMLLLLEHSLYHHHYHHHSRDGAGSSMLYIQDRGVSRWDTCAAEAILYAFGGQLTKLTPYLVDADNEVVAVKEEEDEDSRRYKYLASTTNLDFIPGLATLTRNNCRRHDGNSTDFMKGEQKIMNVEDVKVYSNLCGFVAYGPEWNTVDGKEYITKAIQRTAIVYLPSFN
jgi:3'-phosphoadenosine 5'-phosphosulfate (PAPS) 3'-phosphatase